MNRPYDMFCYFRGIPVKIKNVLPINFSLNQ